MTPEQAIAKAKDGEHLPVYVIVGEENHLASEVVKVLRATVDTGVPGFNEDKYVAAETHADKVVAAARTMPMMAAKRLVLLSGVERWDNKSAKGSPLDVLAAYAADPVDSAVLVISASKINGGRRLMKVAKKGGFLVSCSLLKRHELPRWVQKRAQTLGHRISSSTADTIAELAGPALGAVSDALERLSLYVGEGGEIDEAALAAVVTRIRQETVWALVDALGERDLGAAMAALNDAYDARDGGLPLLGAVAWRVRQMLKFQSMLGRGRSRGDAAKAAGVPGFKATDLERAVRRTSSRELESWLLLLAEADLALKGSRRPGADVLATMLVDMCSLN
jgi:DNA polymerase-3 subunit delta